MLKIAHMRIAPYILSDPEKVNRTLKLAIRQLINIACGAVAVLNMKLSNVKIVDALFMHSEIQS